MCNIPSANSYLILSNQIFGNGHSLNTNPNTFTSNWAVTLPWIFANKNQEAPIFYPYGELSNHLSYVWIIFDEESNQLKIGLTTYPESIQFSISGIGFAIY